MCASENQCIKFLMDSNSKEELAKLVVSLYRTKATQDFELQVQTWVCEHRNEHLKND